MLLCLHLTYLLTGAKVCSPSENKSWGISVFLIYLPNEYYNYEQWYTIHPHRAYLCSLNELYFLIFVISPHNSLKPEQIHSTIPRKRSISPTIVNVKQQYFELLAQEIKCQYLTADLCTQIYAAVECRHLISCARSSKYCYFIATNVRKDETFQELLFLHCGFILVSKKLLVELAYNNKHSSFNEQRYAWCRCIVYHLS